MFHSLDGVDWELLHQQKLVLLTVVDGMDRDSPTAEALWGLVYLLNALQDDAVAAGRWAFPGEPANAVITEPPSSWSGRVGWLAEQDQEQAAQPPSTIAFQNFRLKRAAGHREGDAGRATRPELGHRCRCTVVWWELLAGE
jgi:hypothetical protein